jgi:hypothetical protein
MPGAPGGVAAQSAGLQQITFPPNSRRPCFCCYDQPFLVSSRYYQAGVYHHHIVKETDPLTNAVTMVPADDWICSVLKVLCIVRTNSGNEHSYLLEFGEHGRTPRRRGLLPQSLLLGRPEEAFKALRANGVSITYPYVKLVRAYLDNEHFRFSDKTPGDFWQSVKSVGWTPVGERFVPA